MPPPAIWAAIWFRYTPHVHYAPLLLNAADKTMMAADGYHPSAKGCSEWARLLIEHCAVE